MFLCHKYTHVRSTVTSRFPSGNEEEEEEEEEEEKEKKKKETNKKKRKKRRKRSFVYLTPRKGYHI